MGDSRLHWLQYLHRDAFKLLPTTECTLVSSEVDVIVMRKVCALASGVWRPQLFTFAA